MKQGLPNLVIFIVCLIAISSAAANFLEILLLDAQKKKLREKFESWWLVVSDYDRLKLALAFTQGFNKLSDLFFGEKLVSKKAFYRCAVLASGLLVGSLALTGLFNHQLLGIMPWKNYQESCKAVVDYTDMIVGSGLTKNGAIEKPNVTLSAINMAPSGANMDSMPMTISALTMHSADTNSGALHGNVTVAFWFSKRIGTNADDLSQAQIWSNNVVDLRQGVEKYNTASNALLYSAAFFLVIFLTNVFLCFGSLIICRLILREICASGRVISTLSLLLSNFFCLLIVSSVFLLLLLVLSIPLFWLLVPFASEVAKSSLAVFSMSTLALSFSIWGLNCTPLNLIAAIAFLPFFFSLFATFFSLIAIIGRNWIHTVVSTFLLRCAERSPLTVISACLALIIATVTAVAKLIHGAI
jgi:hypothetical protein